MKYSLYILSLSTILTAPLAHAADTDKPSFLGLSIGYYDVLDDQDGADFRIDYRPQSVVLLDQLKPFLGVEATSQGSLWAGGGLIYDWNFAPNWYISPSIGAGLYTDGGSDIDLDYPVQFRSQLEISYEFEDTSRIGLYFSHMSNAGLGDTNPGTETLGLSWIIPL